MLNFIEKCSDAEIAALATEFTGCRSDQDAIVCNNFIRDLFINSDEFCRPDGPYHEFVRQFLLRLSRTLLDLRMNNPQATLCEAYSQVLREDDSVNHADDHWSYLDLYMMGQPAEPCRTMCRHEWVSFFLYRVDKDNRSGMANQFDEAVRLDSRREVQRIIAAFEAAVRPKRILWISPRNAIEQAMNGMSPLADGTLPFDHLRNSLGLPWSRKPGYAIIAITLKISHNQVESLRVPTCFDSPAFALFRPVSKERYDRTGCGCTCPVQNPEEDGVDELIVWVAGDERQPRHAAALQSRRNDLDILTKDDGTPRLFQVQNDLDLNGCYRSRRDSIDRDAAPAR